MNDLITFVDYVDSLEMRCLYAMVSAAVIPSKFEAASFPVWEAFSARCAVACSRVTSLPKQVGNAALLFDPDDTKDMSRAIESVWKDHSLRDDLVEKGSRQVLPFTWERTARHFRALYRELAGAGVTSDDRDLLAAQPVL
jgi:glycosyltransferase involved in cell wall biosynthesis